MKVYSDKKPPIFFYYTSPKSKENTIIRFCENVFETEGTWNYDEYIIEIPNQSNMDNYIKNHYAELRAEAIGGPSSIQQLYAKLDYISMMSGVDIPTERSIGNG